MPSIREKIYSNGMRGAIEYDPDPQPYDGDTLGQIAYLNSSRYTLGTEAVSRERMDEIAEGIRDGTYIGLPIFAYVHGGATVRAGSGFSCPWDSGQSGFVYVTRDRALNECLTEENALECLKSEVRTFDAYLTGSVYGWVLYNNAGEVIESCWGYYSDDEFDYMLECLDDAVEYKLKEEQQEHDEARYWAERDVVTTL